jgi:type II secretory pathway pseudopilin PulG
VRTVQSSPRPKSRFGKARTRCGYTLLEVQVAFALLGIGLAGICPLVVMQLRQVRQLELRLEGQVIATNPRTGLQQTMLPGIPYYIVPWTNVWAQKLAGSGQILTSASSACDPGYLTLPTSPPQSYPVTIIELDAAPYSQSATVYVDVTAP